MGVGRGVEGGLDPWIFKIGNFFFIFTHKKCFSIIFELVKRKLTTVAPSPGKSFRGSPLGAVTIN